MRGMIRKKKEGACAKELPRGQTAAVGLLTLSRATNKFETTPTQLAPNDTSDIEPFSSIYRFDHPSTMSQYSIIPHTLGVQHIPLIA